MDEFDASTAPTEGREATGGRGSPTSPVKPARSIAVGSDAGLMLPGLAAQDVAIADVSDPSSMIRPILAVTISPPSEYPDRAAPSAEPPRLSALSQISVSPPSPPQQAAPAAMPRLVLGAPSIARPKAGFDASLLRPRIWAWAKRLALYGAIAFAGWFVAVMASIVLFRYVNPPFSNLMLLQRMSGEVLVQKWLPIERMPAQVIRAIVVSEDGRFCEHGGIDIKAIETAIETAKDGTPRGASTITMQVAKNLYLWPSKSYVRKALEVPITLAIEAMWSKRRIFEVYANIAEWGPGVFGVEAAAGYHFGKSAGRVSEREAALLAVALPNPVTRDAGDPGPGTERLANTIQSRMRAQSRAAACIERARRT